MNPQDFAKTLEAFKAALAKPDDNIRKNWVQSGTATSGITAYDLEAPAKLLYPVMTPLRNKIARVTGGLGIQANWRAITGINTGFMPAGVAQGKRNGHISHTTADYLAAFRGVGLEDYVEFEAEYAGRSFDDVKARATTGLLQSTMIQEEFIDLGGNTSVALGTTPTPTLADVATGGAIPQTTVVKVYCIALTLQGYQSVAGWNNGTTGQAFAAASAQLRSQLARTNMDGTTDTVNMGVAQKSAQATVTTATDGVSTHSVRASVAPVRGAVAYAWYWGPNAAETLGAVTTVANVLITTAAGAGENITNVPATADCSTDSLVYDGILTQIMKTGSGAYFVNVANGVPGTGTVLTSDGSGGITEINTAFQAFWDLYRLSPDVMYVSGATLLSLNKLVMQNGGTPLIRYNFDATGSGQIESGTVIASILNKITNKKVKIEVHPNMPSNMIMFWSDSVPYPLSGIGSIVQKKLRQEYYQIEWPLRTRRWEYGVYFDGVLQNYFPPAFGILNNFALS